MTVMQNATRVDSGDRVPRLALGRDERHEPRLPASVPRSEKRAGGSDGRCPGRESPRGADGESGGLSRWFSVVHHSPARVAVERLSALR